MVVKSILDNFHIQVGISHGFELLAVLVYAVLIVTIIVNGEVKTPEGRVFLLLLIFLVIATASDMFIIRYSGQNGYWPRIPLQIACVLTNLAGTASLYLFYKYFLLSVRRRQPVSRMPQYIVASMCLVISVIVIVSVFFESVIYIDRDNNYTHGPYFMAIYLPVMLLDVFFICSALYCRRDLGTADTLRFLSFSLLRIICLVIQIYIPEISAVYMLMVLPVLLIYINIQARRQKEKELELAESRISIMLSQIQPHFLFNSLVAIERLCVSDPALAKETVAGFSDYLRWNLDCLTSRTPVPFERELEHVKTYLSLEKARFSDRLRIKYDINASGFLIPSLTLQPLVENAVRHGISRRADGGTVCISAREEDDTWIITVEDDGVGFDNQAPHDVQERHIGMANVRSRLASISGGRLEISSIPGEGTLVRIVIPKEASPYEYPGS